MTHEIVDMRDGGGEGETEGRGEKVHLCHPLKTAERNLHFPLILFEQQKNIFVRIVGCGVLSRHNCPRT